MSDFETFDLRAWLVDGFTRHIAQPATKVADATRRMHVGVAMAVAAAAVGSMNVSMPASAARMELQFSQVVAVDSLPHANDVIANASEYWQRLRDQRKTWKQAEDSPLRLPEPFA